MSVLSVARVSMARLNFDCRQDFIVSYTTGVRGIRQLVIGYCKTNGKKSKKNNNNLRQNKSIGIDTHVRTVCSLGGGRCLGAVSHVLGVDAASPSAAGRSSAVSAGCDVSATGAAVRVVSVHVVVCLWHHLVSDGLLVLLAEHLLEHQDQGQDEGDLSEQQSFSGDQSEFTEDERQHGGQFEFQHHQQLHESLVLLLCKFKNGSRSIMGRHKSRVLAAL